MFKIRIEFNELTPPHFTNQYLNGWRFDDKLISVLYQNGVEFGEGVSHPDLLFFSIWGTDWKTLPAGDLPIIVYDPYDAGNLLGARNVVSDPRVICVLKGARYSDFSLHNIPYLCDPLPSAFHFGLIADAMKEFTIKRASFWPEINLQEYRKMRTFCGFSRNMNEYQVRRIMSHDLMAPRDVAVHASCNVNYNGTFIEKHRLAMKDALNKWLSKKETSAILGYYWKYRVFSPNIYFDTMLNCKCVVSPWGWGEYCIRDYESLLAGCVLIKPDSSFSETWPELVPNVHYLPVKPDFSDLEERIEEAMSPAWTNPVKRQVLRDHVLQAWNSEILANRFLDVLRDLNLFSSWRKHFRKVLLV